MISRSPQSSPRPSLRTHKAQPSCPTCGSRSITKRGLRKKKFETVQLWKCDAGHSWTPSAPDAQHKTYTPRVLKDVFLSFGLGRTLAQTREFITERRGEIRAVGLDHRALPQ